MRSARTVLAAVLLMLAATLTLGISSAGATSSPWVKVSPSRHLADGDVVTVAAAGLPPRETISVILCDHFEPNDLDEGCFPDKTVTSDRKGRVLTKLTLDAAPIFGAPAGAGSPIYCRADHCRVFLVWGDPIEGVQQSVESRELQFTGSPATIEVTPSTNLRRRQWVTVTGTAFGAEGHRVGVREHVCYDIVQETACYGDLGYVWTKVHRDGTFRVSYLVRRFVPANGYDQPVDCAGDPNERLGDCSVTAVILDRHGQPDNSFGYAEFFGDPRGLIEFATH